MTPPKQFRCATVTFECDLDQVEAKKEGLAQLVRSGRLKCAMGCPFAHGQQAKIEMFARGMGLYSMKKFRQILEPVVGVNARIVWSRLHGHTRKRHAAIQRASGLEQREPGNWINSPSARQRFQFGTYRLPEEEPEIVLRDDHPFKEGHHVRCPISFTIMRDPVILHGSGMTYERVAIEKWLRPRKAGGYSLPFV